LLTPRLEPLSAIAGRHTQSDASAVLSHARLTVGSGEASGLYGAYVNYENERKSNPAAKRVAHLSFAIVALIEN
jgi:hypothetical protein